MTLKKEEWLRLEDKANDLRNLCLQTTFWSGSGHVGGSFSVMDILTVLYYKYMNFNPEKYDAPDRDRCVVSKGHVGIGLAGLFADLGLIEMEDLKTFNLTGSSLGMHLDSNKVKGLDFSTGSLGHGSSLALGAALAGRLGKKDYKTFLILGDGECDEGSVWEAAMATAHFKTGNLITIIDRNKYSIDGSTEDVMSLEPFDKKWEAFGFDVKTVDGHRFDELCDALDYAVAKKDGDKPVCIIAKTIKGQGISFMADNYKWHYGAIDQEKYDIAKKDLAEYCAKRKAVAEKEGK